MRGRPVLAPFRVPLEKRAQRPGLERLNVDVSRCHDGDHAAAADFVREFRRLGRRKHDVYPQPEQVLASWCAPCQAVLPDRPEPARVRRSREWLSRREYEAYEIEMEW